jgi:ribosomal-protein-alanine N-acetyltransferase
MLRFPGVDRRRVSEALSTARLSLTRPRAGDIDAILTITSDPRATAHNPSDALADRRQADELFTSWEAQWNRFGWGYYTLRRHGEDAVVGFCGVKAMLLRGTPVANLFYRLDPVAWGAGLATEAATAVVAFAAGHVEFPVIARVRPANVASQKVAERAGLVRAPELDVDGEDGVDWLYTAPRVVAGPVDRQRCPTGKDQGR